MSLIQTHHYFRLIQLSFDLKVERQFNCCSLTLKKTLNRYIISISDQFVVSLRENVWHLEIKTIDNEKMITNYCFLIHTFSNYKLCLSLKMAFLLTIYTHTETIVSLINPSHSHSISYLISTYSLRLASISNKQISLE